MQDFLGIMSGILGLMKTPMNVYGFTFSLWDVMLVSLIAGIVLKMIVGLFEQ